MLLHGDNPEAVENARAVRAALEAAGVTIAPLSEVLAERMASASQLHQVAAADADRPIVVPEVDDILAVLTAPPKASSSGSNYNNRQRGRR